VQQIFNQSDASGIFKIPLQLITEEGVPRKYSVCSAYYHLMEVIIDNSHLKEEGNWTKPQPGTLKRNVDAACFVNTIQFCIGACIRDANGG
jgi:hypothetical protein